MALEAQGVRPGLVEKRVGRRTTTNDDTGAALTPQQETAAELLATGQTVTDTAAAVGVARQTVSAWLNQDFAFQATLNRRQRELWAGLSARLRALVPKALEAVTAALDDGDVRAALAVLKLAAIPLAPEGATDPADLEADAAEHESDRELRLMLAR